MNYVQDNRILTVEKIHEVLLAHIYENENNTPVVLMHPDLSPLMEQFKEVAKEPDKQLQTITAKSERYEKAFNDIGEINKSKCKAKFKCDVYAEPNSLDCYECFFRSAQDIAKQALQENKR